MSTIIGDKGNKLCDFLVKNCYEIPWYQRDYSWDKKNIEQFLDDQN